MKMKKESAVLAVVLAACGAPPDSAESTPSATAQDPPSAAAGIGPASALAAGTAAAGALGTVRLEAGCSEVADRLANFGLALLHHMTYVEAQQSFAAAVEADPACTMGYWGQAMTIIHPLWSDVPDAAGLERGQWLIELAHARTTPAGRAASYLSTVEAYFKDAPGRTERERLEDFEAAWRAAHEAHPEDVEARALYALARLATVSPTDKSYRQQHEALDLLEGVLDKIPDHPGAHHYVIHARDYPPLAEEALEIARAYGRLAPDVPHALHMPTHIFTRVGLWDESIEGNDRSAETSWRAAQSLGGLTTHFHHALDYLAYAHLQRAEDDAAKAVMERAMTADGPWAAVNMSAIAYALAAIPARYALERRDWDAAANLEARTPGGFPWDERFAPFEALTHFAKALGGARGGRHDVAREAIATLETLGERISATSSNEYWTTQVEVQLLAARAWLAFETGDRSRALGLMRRAADIEASTEKAPVTPGELVPAWELLGEMALEAGEPDEALEAFQAALARSPARLNGLAGAASAARVAGREALAADYYRQLLELTADAEAERPVMSEARSFLEHAGL